MNDLQIFTNSEFGSLGVMLIDGREYFPATECATILGYEKPHNAVERHCRYSLKRGVRVQTGVKADGSPAMKTAEMNFIPEGDLYRLITHSKLPAAVRFESWIFDGVLPTLRRHGMYAADELLDNPDLMIRVLEELKAERTKRKAIEVEVDAQQTQLAILQPKASYYDVILNTPDAIPISVIAKDYGRSAVWLNGFLHEQGIQYKQGDVWLLYAEHADQGFTCSKSYIMPGEEGSLHSKIHTYWTQRGRRFIYELLKDNGVSPVIETS